MSFKGTIYLLQNLVIFENLFGVNRSYLARGHTRKWVCYVLFIMSFIIVFGCLVNDYVILGVHMSLTDKVIQVYNGLELIILAAGATMKKTFVAQERLDLKCGIDDNSLTKFKAMIKTALTVNIVSLAMNFCGGLYLKINISVILIFCYAVAVHDMEIDLMRLLIEGYNMRLRNLKEVTPSAGCRIYRHVLIASSQFGEEFNFRVSIINYP